MNLSEDAIRVKALQFLDGQHVQQHYPDFAEAIKKNILEMPVSRVGMKYCPACESAACGVCGKCHELDHRFLFIGPHCPMAVETGSGNTRHDAMCSLVMGIWLSERCRESVERVSRKQEITQHANTTTN